VHAQAVSMPSIHFCGCQPPCWAQVVRNPVDVVLSAYQYHTQVGGGQTEGTRITFLCMPAVLPCSQSKPHWVLAAPMECSSSTDGMSSAASTPLTAAALARAPQRRAVPPSRGVAGADVDGKLHWVAGERGRGRGLSSHEGGWAAPATQEQLGAAAHSGFA
jgi:hypothetical protein